VILRALVALVALGGALTGATTAAAAGTHVDVQAMLDAAAPGSTVTIPAGTHRGAVTIDHPLRVVGAPGAVLDGEAVGSVVTIDAPDVELTGLTITGSGRNPVGAPSGVLVTASGVGAHVHDVRIRGCYLGVTVQRAADVVLERIDVKGEGIVTGELHVEGEDTDGVGASAHLRGDGIWLYDVPAPTVRDNVLTTVRDGIYLAYGSGARIEGNRIEGSRYAIHDMYAEDVVISDNAFRGNLSGVVLMYGGPVRIDGNRIGQSGSPSTGYAVLVKDASGVTVEDNVIIANRVGMLIDDAGRTGAATTTIEANTVALNQVGVVLVPSAEPMFTRNAFVDNTTQVTLGGTGVTQAIWSSDGVGNHWSDYAGYDADGDGVGDVPYTRSGRASGLLAGAPLLQALASGPAFRLLSAVEDRWMPGAPLVRDAAPLVSPATRAVAAGPNVGGGPAPLPHLGIGLVLIATAAVAIRAGRGRRRIDGR
jgi:nitrous oxidase accessory protein